MGERMKKASMNDVARLAGVSVATVSYALSGKRFVSDEIKERVNEAIARLSYTPNLTARSLKTGRSNVVFFIVPDIGNSFFSTAVEEVENAVSGKGYRLLIANTKEDVSREILQLQGVNKSVVDGIILASTADTVQQILPMFPADVPIILFDRFFERSNLDYVICDSTEVLSEAVRELNRRGHSQIGFISGLSRLSSSQERLSSYETAMRNCGLDILPEYVKAGNSDYTCVETACKEMIDAGITAIVASNGSMSFYARHACMMMGKTLGKDIEIIGFVDAPNTDMMQDYFATITLPIVEASRIAGEEIVRRIEEEDSDEKHIHVPATVKYRDK